MTKINKLIFDGFKSFGKRTELTFGDTFNVVLGPNGSGKSNVIDALCFVLGKSSAKSMRAEKSANLIYNGGKSKNPAKSAEVSIVFDNSKKTFPSEESEIKLSRIVKQSGASTYKINGKTRTRQEVLDLLSIARIDPNGYNIILQGDIVQFCNMSGKERRQIVEEIAGISIYEDKKHKSLNELNKVDEKLQQAEIILKERATYLKDLKKDRDQALKFKTLMDKLRQNQATYLKKKINKRTDNKTRLDKKINAQKSKFDNIIAKIKIQRDDIISKRAEIKKISLEIEQKGEKEQVEIQKEIEQLRVDVATSQTKVSGLKNELTELAKRQEEINETLGATQEKINQWISKRDSLEKEKKHNLKQSEELNLKIEKFKKKHKINQNTDEIEKELIEIDSKTDEFEKKLSGLRENQQNLLRKKDRLEFQIQTIDGQIEKVEQLEKENKTEIVKLKQNKKEFKKTILELNQLLNDDSKLAAQIGQNRQNLQNSKEKIAKLEVESIKIKEAMASNIAVKKILETGGKLGQIYGTVAELLSTEDKYSTALEIAGGKKIHSVVVADDKVAAACIRYLKQNKFGTAAFLPLNKIKGRNLKIDISKLNGRGVYGEALGLITFEPKFKAIFQYVFGGIIVVENMDIARRIGIGSAKMVTLDGDLAEMSGAMIGGFRRKKKGIFKGKNIDKEILELQAEEGKIYSSISKIEKKKEENEERIQRLRQHKAELEGEIIKMEKSLHLDSNDLEASLQYKEELKIQIKNSDKELDDIMDVISERNSELAKLKMKKHELRSNLNQLKNPRLIAELNTFETKQKELNDSLLVLSANLKNMNEKIDEIKQRDEGKVKTSLDDIKTKERKLKLEMNELEKEIKQKTSNLKHKEKDQVKFQSHFKTLFEKRNKYSDLISETENKIFKLEDSSRKEELQINTVSIELAKVNTELSSLEVEYSEFEGVALAMNKTEEQLKKEINDAERMKSNIGNVNMKALEIFETVEKEFNKLTNKKETLMGEKEDVLKLLDEIELSKKDLFLKHLKNVRDNFVSIFSELNSKGEVELELENPEDPFEGGLKIKVRLAGNKFLDIRSLSGGEKTMTALAFIFAIQEHAPATFYIMDEVDAALDKHNSEKLAKLVRKYCTRAQYIVISHNDSVISEGDNLFGISMNEHGISNIVSIKV